MYAVQPRFKLVYFDRSIIRSRWSKFNKNPLEKAGNVVRKIARQSIKRRKLGGRSGPIGEPPRSRQPGATPPFKMIYSVPYQFGTTVIVGMVGFNSEGMPGYHEHGGRAFRFVFARNTYNRFGGRVRRSVRYPRRPFMMPALVKGKQRFPALWRNSLSH
jgi:hypothetical protein